MASVNVSKIILLGPIHQDGLDILEARADVSYEIVPHAASAREIEAKMPEADAIIVRNSQLRAPAVALAERAKVVSRHGVGFDNIDVDALTARGIPLTVIGDANAVTVAEHTFALMLALAKDLPAYDREMRAGNFAFRESLRAFDLAGKTLLIVGFGRVGTRVAARAAAFDLKIIVADPFVPRRVVEGTGYAYVKDFREALGQADIVTLHMPAEPGKAPEMGAAEFNAMKPGSLLVNCARGLLLDEVALVAVLTNGPLRGAGLDVTFVEPTPAEHPLFALDNVIVSPHMAASTNECMRRMACRAARNALDGLDGCIDDYYVVNTEVLTL